ncbi:MAG: hypothetical protein H7145_09315 [Akkermansiaceae bacterium]|nr:hypothetical protein [Armatimonadota bacterium]
MKANTLPPFESVFGAQTYRLRGIGSWEQVPLLGTGNMERLRALLRGAAMRLLGESESRDDLREVQSAITFLSESIASAMEDKPLLPRLRVESFRKGNAVHIYLGDSAGTVAPGGWVTATITEVDKAFRPDWNDGTENGGYFWRWTATAAVPLFPGQNTVRFSTSEPRVLLAGEFAYLQKAVSADPDFLEMYCANAWRTWEPLWCIERETHTSGEAMNMRRWISESVSRL